MTAERIRIGWGFWLRWVLTSSLGWFVGFLGGHILADIVGYVIASEVPRRILQASMNGVGLGAGVSIMQWLVLRRRVPRARWWVLASTAGLAVAGGAGYAVAVVALGYSEALGSLAAALGWTVVVAFGGAVTGIFQWLVLRRQVSRAGWWVLASTVGWGLGMAVAGAIEVGAAAIKVVLVGLLFRLFFGAALVGGAVLGAVTGGALVWLLRQPVPEA